MVMVMVMVMAVVVVVGMRRVARSMLVAVVVKLCLVQDEKEHQATQQPRQQGVRVTTTFQGLWQEVQKRR